MKKIEFSPFLIISCGIIVSLAIAAPIILPADKAPLWAMSQDARGTVATAYDEKRVSESFGVGIFTQPSRQNGTPSTALRRISPNESLEGYLWVNNQMTTGNDFLVFGLLDYQQVPFEFNDSGTGAHHSIHLEPFNESFYRFRIPPLQEGSHDFELFLVMKPGEHSLEDSYRIGTDQGLLGSRRLNIIVGNSTTFSPAPLKTYKGPAISCGPEYVLNDGLLVTTNPCDTKALLSDHVNSGQVFNYSVNIAADKNYPVSVAIVPLLDYRQIPLSGSTNDTVAFFNLDPGTKLAIPVNARVPESEGIHELVVLWIPAPYQSIDDDAKSVRPYHQWAWSEPSIRIGLDARSGTGTVPRTATGGGSVSNLYLIPAGIFDPLHSLIEPAATTVLPATTGTPEHGDYCYIQEVYPDALGKAIIVHLTSWDLEDFPQYGRIIMNSGNSTKKWINGHRTAGDFIDYGHQYENFWNLSCRNLTWDECQKRALPTVFEYDGRYYEPACLPDFGGAHASRDT